MIFVLDCLGKNITQTKLKVLTEYTENSNEIILNRTTVEPVYSGHLRFLENLSAIGRCPLHRGSSFFREKTLINVNPTTG